MSMVAPSLAAAGGPELGEVIETAVAAALDPQARAEAMSALGNLGYGPGEAAGAVAEALAQETDADTAALIRAALKKLVPKG